MPTYREIFAIREFRALFAVRLFVMTGVVLSGLGLGTVTYQLTGSPILSGLAMFGAPLLQVVSGHFLLATADLVRPRVALIWVASLAAVSDLLQMLPHLPWGWRFVILATETVLASATSGAAIALLGDIVPSESFMLARATMNLTVGGMQILGNALGAVLLLRFSTSALFGIAALVEAMAAIMARVAISNHAARAAGNVVTRTQHVNRVLLGSSVVRPIYLMMWLPNGLIVGCEAMFMPYAATRAGWLFGAAAAGMLLGDVVIGRFLRDPLRDRLIVPLRVLLAAPYLLFWWHPPLVVAAAVVFVASFGYPAALPLQERLVSATDADMRGQVFGLAGTGLMVGQGLGALIAGTVAQLLGVGAQAAAGSMVIMAVASLTLTGLLSRGLARSRRFGS